MFLKNLLFLVLFSMLTVMAGAEPLIEIIYWKSFDVESPTTQDINSLRGMMVIVQSFFASEMDRYGYGPKTFDFNRNITVVEGKKKLAEYIDAKQIQREYPTIEYGLQNAIYIVFMGGATSFGGAAAVSQQLCANIPEQLEFCNNLIVVPANNKRLREVLTAHEVGHGFNLDHPPKRLIKNRIDIMYFPLHVVPGQREYLKNYALNPEHAKSLDDEGRLFIQSLAVISISSNLKLTRTWAAIKSQ